MMHVGYVRVPVPHFGMPMRMHMRFAGRVVRQVLVLVMFIVHMGMRVLHRLMLVLMFVLLGEVQPDANAHQEAGRDKLERERLAQKQDGGDRTQEWRGREVGSRARSPELTQSQYK